MSWGGGGASSKQLVNKISLKYPT